jgi:hypothetical protein
MNWLWRVGGVVGLIYCFSGFVYNLFRDLQHPETWDQNWLHDPRAYLPLVAIVFGVCGYLFYRWYKDLLNSAKPRIWAEAVAESANEEVERLRAFGQFVEAKEVLRQASELLARGPFH